MRSHILRGACVALLVAALPGGVAHAQGIVGTLPGKPATGEVGHAKGRVVDRTGRPIPQAEVRMLSAPKASFTDADGHFAVPNLPAGEHIALIRRIGFRPVTISFSIEDGSVREWEVQLNSVGPDLPELVTIAERLAPLRREHQEMNDRLRRGSSRMISRDVLRRFANIGDAIAYQVGQRINRGFGTIDPRQLLDQNEITQAARALAPRVGARQVTQMSMGFGEATVMGGSVRSFGSSGWTDIQCVYTSVNGDQPNNIADFREMNAFHIEAVEVVPVWNVADEFPGVPVSCMVVIIWT
ncbi:MAG: carboxypeptidase regulatory-like domain-containing protein [Gemmatimonadales bacterium]|nr:carboxypeptidase regulatory-like domain-containing protein [Gemmatimonadales bacterium]